MIHLLPAGMRCQCQSQKCWKCWACRTWLTRKWWSGCKCAVHVSHIPFFEYQNIGKSQPPAFQSPSVLHPIRIIQHPWELIHFKWWGTRLWLWWFDMSNSSGMYMVLKSVINWGPVLNWGHQTFRHQEARTYSDPFLAVYNLVKNFKKNPLADEEITSLDICHSNLSVRRPVRDEIFLLKPRPFLTWGHNQSLFCPFIPGSTQFQQHFLGSKKVAKIQKFDVIY